MKTTLLHTLTSTAMVITALVQIANATTVIPSTLLTNEGSGNIQNVFDVSTSRRTQQVFSSSYFSNSPGRQYITEIAFRLDGSSFGLPFSANYPSITIDLSTTAKAIGGLSLAFASNVGGDVATVYSGALTFSSSGGGPAAGPRPFNATITFTTPFAYNPADGNLLLDIKNFGGGNTTQDPWFDGINGSSTYMSWVTTHLGADQANAFSSLGGGYITQFTTSPVPEPSCLLLSAIGIISIFRRNR